MKVVPNIFRTSDLIDGCFYRDEFEAVIVYGPLGYGKSSFATQVLAELYGDNDSDPKDPNSKHWNWEGIKRKVLFHPKDFINYLLNMESREKAIIWDDAGLWLYALDWFSPFIKAVGKYLNVARTHLGAIIFTTPLPTYIMKRVRDFPQVKTIKIMKQQSDVFRPTTQKWVKPRIAKCYSMWISPDMQKSGVKEIFADFFNAMLPDDYFSWYKPYRDAYAHEAVMMMRKEMRSLLKNTTGEETPEELESKLDRFSHDHFEVKP